MAKDSKVELQIIALENGSALYTGKLRQFNKLPQRVVEKTIE